MKKILTVLMLLAAVALTAAGLSACKKKPHEHVWSEWETTAEATCEEDGEKTRSCECGETETEVIPAAGHALAGVWTESVAPTCTADGEEKQTCSVCGDEVTRAIPATGHSWSEFEQVSAPTCTNVGVEQRLCETCGAQDERETEKTAHTPVIVEGYPADCVLSGLTDGAICSVCLAELVPQEPIAPLGHKLSYEHKGAASGDGVSHESVHEHVASCERCPYSVRESCLFDTEETPATCTAPLHHKHTCRFCSFSYEHDEGEPLGHIWSQKTHIEENGTHKHVQVCIRGGSEAGHPTIEEECAFGEETTVEPTCYTAGYTVRSCEGCGYEERSNHVDRKQHEFVYEDPQINALGYWTHVRRCLNCSYRATIQCSVTRTTVKASCTEDGKYVTECVYCRQRQETKFRDKFGHAYGSYVYDGSDGNDRHKRVCATCGDEEFSDCEFRDASEAPTCNKAGQSKQICTKCLHVEHGDVIPGLEHVFEGAFTPDGTGGHYRLCANGCGERETIAHTLSQTVTPATCEVDGRVDYLCEECGFGYSETIDARFGHDFEEWNIEADRHYAECKKCGETLSFDHDYESGNLCAECGHDALVYEYGDGTHTWATARFSAALRGAEHISVAPYWEGVPVWKIGGQSALIPAVTHLELPYTLKEIGTNAFFGCSDLVSVTIGGAVLAGEEDSPEPVPALETIGYGAFSRCSALSSVRFPDSLRTIEASAFKDCTSLVGIRIPDTVGEIGDGAFDNTGYANASSSWVGGALYIGRHLLKARPDEIEGEYEIWANTATVGARAFKDCTALRRIVIPASATVFDRDAFDGCTGLRAVEYEGDFASYLKIRFVNDLASPMHYASEITFALESGRVEIPAGTTAIPAGAFRGSSISSIVIPASVTSIGAHAFDGCASLSEIVIEGKVDRLGAHAFDGTAYAAAPEHWEQGVLYIENMLVAAAKADEATGKVVLKEGVCAIAPGAFEGCSGMTEIVIPASLQFIGAGAFRGLGATLSQAHFLGRNGSWFCSTEQGLGRSQSEAQYDGDPTAGARALHYYGGEWRRLVQATEVREDA